MGLALFQSLEQSQVPRVILLENELASGIPVCQECLNPLICQRVVE